LDYVFYFFFELPLKKCKVAFFAFKKPKICILELCSWLVTSDRLVVWLRGNMLVRVIHSAMVKMKVLKFKWGTLSL